MRAAALVLTVLAACGADLHPPAAVPGDYRRIAVIGPSTAANLWAAGQGERVVAVSDLPRIGGQVDPALETLTRLQPDLVLAQGAIPSLERWCGRNQVPLVGFTTDSMAGWRAEMTALGALLAAPEAFAAVVADADRRLAEVAAAAQGRPAVTTLLVVSRRPGEIGGLLAAGGGSFVSELLEVAGGRNVHDAEQRDYFDLAEETLVRLAPECIVEFHPTGVGPDDQPLEIWRAAFPNLPAVRDGRVVSITLPDALMPGPAMPDTAAALAAALHPAR